MKNLDLENVHTVVIDDMNHMLKKQDQAYSILTLNKIYKNLKNEPISSELVNEIKHWVQTISIE
ncbi:hypothetical protein PN4B1_42180 [Paenibacillus naphthalenovorans]|nr:hypothetical protein PN4B1_42180 [Paenibacillus naphthalenovorans]